MLGASTQGTEGVQWVGAAAAPGCGGQSRGGRGGGLQVGEQAPRCFSWERDSLSEGALRDYRYPASGSTSVAAAEHARCPAVQPVFVGVVGQG